MFLQWLFGNKKLKVLGTVVHYFDKIGVAVVVLGDSLRVGDKIKIVRAESEFEETVKTMQIDHHEVMSAVKGQEVAIKISQPTKNGARVYKL